MIPWRVLKRCQKPWITPPILTRTMATDNKSFSKTLLLPKTNFPLWVDPANTEKPFQARTTEDLYRWQVTLPAEESMRSTQPISVGKCQGSLVRSPRRPSIRQWGPSYGYATCIAEIKTNTRLGHALNKILKDIITRYHVSRGRRVQYAS